MKKQYENKSLLLNADLADKKKGQVIQIKTDKEGTPIERYWRDRLKDAKMDGCVEFVKSTKSAKSVSAKSVFSKSVSDTEESSDQEEETKAAAKKSKTK